MCAPWSSSFFCLRHNPLPPSQNPWMYYFPTLMLYKWLKLNGKQWMLSIEEYKLGYQDFLFHCRSFFSSFVLWNMNVCLIRLVAWFLRGAVGVLLVPFSKNWVWRTISFISSNYITGLQFCVKGTKGIIVRKMHVTSQVFRHEHGEHGRFPFIIIIICIIRTPQHPKLYCYFHIWNMTDDGSEWLCLGFWTTCFPHNFTNGLS